MHGGGRRIGSFVMPLYTLRERSSEASPPEYLASLAFSSPRLLSPTGSPPVRRPREQKEQACRRQLREPGGLSLDMFPKGEPCTDHDPGRLVSDASSSCYDMSPPSTIRGGTAHDENLRHGNTLRASGLEKYSRANDCLSNLRSSSGGSSGVSVHGAAEDAAAAARGWQRGLSTPPTADRSVKRKSFGLGVTNGSGGSKIHDRFSSLTSRSRHYDGTSEDLGEPSSTRETVTTEDPRRTVDLHPKRKASVFSMRSRPETMGRKRRRSPVLQRFADTISQKLTSVRRKLRHRREPPGRPTNFAAWKAARVQAQRTHRTDAPSQSGLFGVGLVNHSADSSFAGVGSGEGGSEWWNEGASKYSAPPWMAFGSGGSLYASAPPYSRHV
ncbi:hypothetical protein GMORB2_5504 [Geosmithia morbida]|uniref:Uncharacterized protein n=1 Tax=Geosmithia morbida TaxID=1094350 RepID=A0A9P4YVC2_9HYPO|nr:uncharacterized protein GMORB2_5504 [Geosmithia morbida]KAF4123788.1 hypothetical protein GMORB2_5504 [Geosmithia morbida]